MRIVLGLGASLACALFGLEWKLGVPWLQQQRPGRHTASTTSVATLSL